MILSRILYNLNKRFLRKEKKVIIIILNKKEDKNSLHSFQMRVMNSGRGAKGHALQGLEYCLVVSFSCTYPYSRSRVISPVFVFVMRITLRTFIKTVRERHVYQ